MRGRLLALAVALLSIAPPVALAVTAEEGSPPGTHVIPIPVAEIVARAAEVSEVLAGIGSRLGPDHQLQVIEAELPERTVRSRALLDATARALTDRPTQGVLDDLAGTWEAAAGQLRAWAAIVAREVTRLEADLQRLTELRLVWLRTAEETRQSGAPEAVVARVDATLAAIASTRAGIAAEHSRLLALQDRVVQAEARNQEVLARIARTRASSRARLLAPDSPPIWRMMDRRQGWVALSGRLWKALDGELTVVGQFVEERAADVPLRLALFGSLIAVLFLARRRARRWPSLPPGLARPAEILEYPFSSALVLTILLLPGPVPRVVRAVLVLVVLLPVVRILRRLIDPALRGGLYAFGALFVVDRIGDLLSRVPTLGQAFLLAEMPAGALVVLWFLQSGRIARPAQGSTGAAPGPALVLARRAVGWALLAALCLAGVAGALGYMQLARLIGGGALWSGYVGLVLYTGVFVVESLVVHALQGRPLSLLFLVQHHRALLERRVRTGLTWAAVVAWIVGTLSAVELAAPATAAVVTGLTAPVRWGAISLSLDDVLAFALTVWLSFQVSAFLRFVFEEDIVPRVSLGRGMPYAISSLGHYAIVLVGFLVGVTAMGLDLTRLTILVGALGVGIGLGLQDVTKNFVSGLILLLERPIQVGDAIQVGELEGEVRHIGMRASTVRTWRGAEVIVPNGSLIADRVVNWTLSDRMRRIDLPVAVAYGTDPERVIAILCEAADRQPGVTPEPAPLALFMGFGDSALSFELRVWTTRFEESTIIRSQLGVLVYAALRAASIDIPFPQRQVHLRRPARNAPGPLPGGAPGAPPGL